MLKVKKCKQVICWRERIRENTDEKKSYVLYKKKIALT